MNSSNERSRRFKPNLRALVRVMLSIFIFYLFWFRSHQTRCPRTHTPRIVGCRSARGYSPASSLAYPTRTGKGSYSR